jgi:SpoIIAA-like
MRAVIERIDDMPAGILGLRASGKLSRADYRDVLEPALREALQSGELRVLFVLSDFEGLEPGAWIEDVKTGLEVLVGHHSAWKRFALVTDVDWIAKAKRTFAWLIPGEMRIFDPNSFEDARSWVAG